MEFKFSLSYDKKGDEDPIEHIIIALYENGVTSLLDNSRKVLFSTIEFEFHTDDIENIKEWMNSLTEMIEPVAFVKLYLIKESSGKGRTDINTAYKKIVKDLSAQGLIKVNQHIKS